MTFLSGSIKPQMGGSIRVQIDRYEVVEQVAEPNRGMHNVYVLLKLPFDEFNKVLQQEKAKTLDKKVQASFDDLERRLKERRQQRLEEQRQIFDQEQEALKNRMDALQPQEKDKARIPQDNPRLMGLKQTL